MKTYSLNTEDQEQRILIEWCELNRQKYPQLDSIFAVPNGKMRHPAIAAQLKKEGVKSGVPDLFLSFPSNNFHGLYIEMKRLVGGRLSDNQKIWRDRLISYGYCVQVCKGWEAAKDAILNYLTPTP